MYRRAEKSVSASLGYKEAKLHYLVVWCVHRIISPLFSRVKIISLYLVSLASLKEKLSTEVKKIRARYKDLFSCLNRGRLDNKYPILYSTRS